MYLKATKKKKIQSHDFFKKCYLSILIYGYIKLVRNVCQILKRYNKFTKWSITMYN